MDTTHKRLTSIEFQLTVIHDNIIEIKSRLDKIDKSCSNMDDHISFVESTYNYIKSIPLPSHTSLVESTYNYIKSIELPSLPSMSKSATSFASILLYMI